VGDIVLPDITPWPTREELFDEVAQVIKPHYTQPNAIFGLQRYIQSLKKLGAIARKHPDLLVLPAHRFYYKGQWNGIQLTDRVNELLEHHVQRCAAIIEILRNGPKTAEELAQEHFDERLLEGFGSIMAANEIVSHCEFLIACGDIVGVNQNKYGETGTGNFEKSILTFANK
jgi:hypothetical protein